MDNLLQSYFEILFSLPRNDQKYGDLSTYVNSVSNAKFREMFNEKLESLIHDMDRFDSVLEKAYNVNKAEIDLKQAQIEYVKTLTADLVSQKEKSTNESHIDDNSKSEVESRLHRLPVEPNIPKTNLSSFMVPELPRAPSMSDYGLKLKIDHSKSQPLECSSSLSHNDILKGENPTVYRIPQAPKMSDYGLTAIDLTSKDGKICAQDIPKAPCLSDYGLKDKVVPEKSSGTFEVIHIPKAPCLEDYGLDPMLLKKSILPDKELMVLSENQETNLNCATSYIKNPAVEALKSGKDSQVKNEIFDQFVNRRKTVDYGNNNDRRSKKHSSGANSGSMNGSFMDVSPTKFNYADFLRKSNKVTGKLIFDNTDDSLTDIAK